MTRANSEDCLFAVRGKLPARMDASICQHVTAPRTENSRKPDVIREKLVQLLGDVHALSSSHASRLTVSTCGESVLVAGGGVAAGLRRASSEDGGRMTTILSNFLCGAALIWLGYLVVLFILWERPTRTHTAFLAGYRYFRRCVRAGNGAQGRCCMNIAEEASLIRQLEEARAIINQRNGEIIHLQREAARYREQRDSANAMVKFLRWLFENSSQATQ